MADNEMVQRVCMAAAGTLLIVLLGFKISQGMKLLIIYWIERVKSRHTPAPPDPVESITPSSSMLNHEFIPTKELIGFGLWFRNRYRNELVPGKYESLMDRYAINFRDYPDWASEGFIRIGHQPGTEKWWFEMPYTKLTGKDGPDPEFVFFSILWAQCAVELMHKASTWTQATTICHLADKKTLQYYMTLDRPVNIILETYLQVFNSEFGTARYDHIKYLVNQSISAQTV